MSYHPSLSDEQAEISLNISRILESHYPMTKQIQEFQFRNLKKNLKSYLPLNSDRYDDISPKQETLISQLQDTDHITENSRNLLSSGLTSMSQPDQSSDISPTIII